MYCIAPTGENMGIYIQDHCYFEGYRDTNMEQIGYNVEVTENCAEKETCNSSAMKQRIKNAHIIIRDQSELKKDSDTGNQQIIYLPPVGYCTEHEDLFLLEDKRLVKPGDKFKSHNDFVQYLNENAKRWFYYYKCSDSRKPNTEHEMYLYTCVYLRNKEKYVKKGLRKRNNNHKTNCPCKIKLRHLPHEKELTVVFVCNHHDHPLSEEEFYKLQHGRRLPPHIKEEIMDLLTLQVDLAKIRKYVHIATGFNMSRAFFYAIERTLKSRSVKRHISDEKVRSLMKRLNGNIFDTVENKSSNHSEDKINETETLQSVRNLEESVKCETQHNPWITDQCVPVLSNGALTVLVTDDAAFKENHDKHLDKGTIEMIMPEKCNHSCGNETTECNAQEPANSEVICMGYETVVSRADIDNEYCDNDNVYNDLEHYDDQIHSTYSDNEVKPADVNCDDAIVEYVNDDVDVGEYLKDDVNRCNDSGHKNNDCDEEIIEYEVNYDNINEAKDAEVQTCDKISKQNPLVSVFDVCMKDGNVTGFIVNNEVMNQLKNDRVEKGVQTEEINFSDPQTEDSSTTEPTADSYIELTPDGTHYIKHEYIHKYNIDKYMCRPNFPKYIEVLSKKTGIEVLQMFTNVYNERAMFKMITTQNDREGNTRILYVTNPHEIPYNVDMKKREELGNRLREVFVLKGKVRALERKNTELEAINKQLITSLR